MLFRRSQWPTECLRDNADFPSNRVLRCVGPYMWTWLGSRLASSANLTNSVLYVGGSFSQATSWYFPNMCVWCMWLSLLLFLEAEIHSLSHSHRFSSISLSYFYINLCFKNKQTKNTIIILSLKTCHSKCILIHFLSWEQYWMARKEYCGITIIFNFCINLEGIDQVISYLNCKDWILQASLFGDGNTWKVIYKCLNK